MAKIEFYVVDAMELAHYVPIWRALSLRGIESKIVAIPGKKNQADAGWFNFDDFVNSCEKNSIPYSTQTSYNAHAITTQNEHLLRNYKGLHIRLMYGPVFFPDAWAFQSFSIKPFDAILVHGSYYEKVFSKYKHPSGIKSIGYPMYDEIFRQHPVHELHYSTNKQLNILYLPTWSANSSLDRFLLGICKQAQTHHMTIRPHHCTVRFEPERMSKIIERGMQINTAIGGLPNLMAKADLVVADVRSGAVFESIMCGRQVVALTNNYKKDISWLMSTGADKFVTLCDNPEKLTYCIDFAMHNLPELKLWQDWVDGCVISRKGEAATKAAEVIADLVFQHPLRKLRWYGNRFVRTEKINIENKLEKVPQKVVSKIPKYFLLKKLLKQLSEFPNENLSPKLANLNLALNWLEQNTISDSGIKLTNDSPLPYPEVSGYFIPTLLNWGRRDLALQYAGWLLSVQNADGSWSDPHGESPYTFDTGQILKGLLEVDEVLPEARQAVIKGCDWMLTQISVDGEITTPDKQYWKLAGGRMISDKIHLYCLSPLIEAGRRYDRPEYTEHAGRAVRHYLARPDILDFDTLSHFHAYVMEALVDLGFDEEARIGMKRAEQKVLRSGVIPAYPDVKWICSTGLLQYATVWFKLGEVKKGEKLLYLASKFQNPGGGFFGSYGKGSNYFETSEISWAVKYLLDAHFWRIKAAFEHTAPSFPEHIDSSDGRYQLIKNSITKYKPKKIMDLGCGKGRFIHLLKEQFPDTDAYGLDLSSKMLSLLSDDINKVEGTLLRIPLPDESIDFAFAVESFEHAVFLDTAITEAARVLAVGGILLVIDKDQAKKDQLEIESWEQWIDVADFSRLLKVAGFNVEIVRNIPYDSFDGSDGLFVGFVAQKIN